MRPCATLFSRRKHNRTRKEPHMVHDSTLLLRPSSSVWEADWENVREQRMRDSLGEFIVYTVDVRRRADAPRPEVPEGFDRVVSNGRKHWTLRHASTGNSVVMLHVEATQWVAKGKNGDGSTKTKRINEEIPFKAEGKRRYTRHFVMQVGRQMAGYGTTVKKCSQFCHVAPIVVKEIDLKRLRALAGDLKPTHFSDYLAVDEFKIATPRRFCTIVVDAKTGELLYLRRGKTKKQVLSFFDWVGEEFMSHVKAVAMDMNANYSAAFEQRYPEIQIVWDPFHISQNYNDKVVDGSRRTEANALKRQIAKFEEEGDLKSAKELAKECQLLYGMRFTLVANRTTLEANDRLNEELNKAEKALAIERGEDPDKVGNRRTDSVERLDALIATNEKMNAVVKAREELQDYLRMNDSAAMRLALEGWVARWSKARISQLTRFCNLVTRRMDGIVARADHDISSGVLEGTNALVKAVLRQSFGMQDMDYFGLKLWEKTHLPNGTRRVELGDTQKPKRDYVRKASRNERRAVQTIYVEKKEARGGEAA